MSKFLKKMLVSLKKDDIEEIKKRLIINEEDSQMTKIAVVGVMESVGREILSFLEEDGIKAKDVFAVDYKFRT